MYRKFQSIIILSFVLLTLNSCHVGRFFIWNFADIKDPNKFPNRSIEKSPESFIFKKGTDEGLKFPKSILMGKKEVDFETFLDETHTVGFLVIRNDSILYEKYKEKFNEESNLPSFSVAKSFVSALLGIAISEGYIKSVREPITNYLTEMDKDAFGKITIEDVLNMRSGIRYNESYINPFGHVAKYYYGRNLNQYISKLKVKNVPNQNFEYISVNTQILGFIIEKATGRKLEKYLEEKIWKPLGMEYRATWSIDSKVYQNVKAFCCLNAKLRDFAKLGRLYLQKGNWNGKQIVPASWVEQSLKPQIQNNFIYSYQWWHNIDLTTLNEDTKKGEFYKIVDFKQSNNDEGDTKKQGIIQPSGDFYAEGILGQFVYVYPEKNIIIVRFGKKYGYKQWSKILLAIARAN